MILLKDLRFLKEKTISSHTLKGMRLVCIGYIIGRSRLLRNPMFRTLIRVVAKSIYGALVTVPAFEYKLFYFPKWKIPTVLWNRLEDNYRFHAITNISAETEKDFYIDFSTVELE
jgi:hypothetical protein